MNLTQQTSFRLLAIGAVLAAIASAPAQAAQASANAGGTVVTPIAVVAATDLQFGTFAALTGGTITVSTSGARSSTVVFGMAGATPTAARFNITGQASTTYSITHSGTAVLTNTTGVGAETMNLAKCSDLNAGNITSGTVNAGLLDATGNQSLYVGGTLTVASNQAPGVYSGSIVATVEYN